MVTEQPFPILIPADEEQLAVLGRLLAYCAHVELFLFALGKAGLTEPQLQRFARAPASEKLGKLQQLIPAATPVVSGKYQEAVDRLARAFEIRNTLVHGAWMTVQGTGEAFAVKPGATGGAVPTDLVHEALELVTAGANALIAGMFTAAGIEDFPLPVPVHVTG